MTISVAIEDKESSILVCPRAVVAIGIHDGNDHSSAFAVARP